MKRISRKKDTLGKIKKAFKKGKIEIASQTRILELIPWVDKVLVGLGHPEALVTDESMVRDFMDVWSKRPKKINICGLLVPAATLIVDVAQMLKDKDG